jgi:very-short-patch-repair endonuclease
MQPVFRGVYLHGPAPPLPGAIELAALMSCGPRARVSHRSAAALWGLAKPDETAVDITVVGVSAKSRTGLRAHRSRELHRCDRAVRNGIPLTALARTLIDFAHQSSGGELERALSEAYALKLVTEGQIWAAIDRAPMRPGAGLLRAVLELMRGPLISRSEAEHRVRRLISDALLPAPMANALVAGHEVDLFWPTRSLILEIDGYAFHSHRRAFENDRRRDATLVAAGYRVIRVTWRQLTEEPLAVVATLAAALGSRPPDSRPHD